MPRRRTSSFTMATGPSSGYKHFNIKIVELYTYMYTCMYDVSHQCMHMSTSYQYNLCMIHVCFVHLDVWLQAPHMVAHIFKGQRALARIPTSGRSSSSSSHISSSSRLRAEWLSRRKCLSLHDPNIRFASTHPGVHIKLTIRNQTKYLPFLFEFDL